MHPLLFFEKGIDIFRDKYTLIIKKDKYILIVQEVITMKWDCRGVNETIENIKNFLATSKKADKNFIAYKALKQQEKVISALLKDSENDENCLLSYRRQVRLLLRQVTQ